MSRAVLPASNATCASSSVPYSSSNDECIRPSSSASGTPADSCAWSMASWSPVSPTNRVGRSASKRPRYSPSTSGVSMAGSVVTKTTCTSSASAGSSPRSATATSAIVVGQTSGQFV